MNKRRKKKGLPTKIQIKKYVKLRKLGLKPSEATKYMKRKNIKI